MSSDLGFSIFGILFMLVAAGLSLLAFAFWIWMLIDCIQNRGLDSNEKLIWVLVIVLTNLIGALIYFFVGRPKRGLVVGA